jgi:hypothetical protein
MLVDGFVNPGDTACLDLAFDPKFNGSEVFQLVVDKLLWLDGTRFRLTVDGGVPTLALLDDPRPGFRSRLRRVFRGRA